MIKLSNINKYNYYKYGIHNKHLKSLYKTIIDVKKINSLKTIKEFDEYYTAPVNNFLNADDYYQKASSKPFLKTIKTGL